MIFANKQDLPGAKTIEKLIEDYEFNNIKNHIWHIEPCSAVKGEGLVNGIKWLSEQLVFRGKNNFPNNPYLVDEEESNVEKKKTPKEESVNSTSNINTNNIANEVVGDINKNEEKKEDEVSNVNNIEINTSSQK